MLVDDGDDVVLFRPSYAQERMWYFYRLDPGNPFYTVPLGLRLTGELDVAALRGALNDIADRHEILRTTFGTVESELVQVVASRADVELPVVEVPPAADPELPVEEREEVRRLLVERVRPPFDLERGPLLRATLFRLGPADHLLLFVLHHIIHDGWSLGVLGGELSAAYRARVTGTPGPLPPLEVQYGDFAEWQRDWLSGEVLESQLAYWRGRLGGELPVLGLPLDRPRPEVQSFRGGRVELALSPALSDAVKDLGRRCGATPFMVLLASFLVLLHRYSRQDDIVVGSPVANRHQAKVEPLIGLFVNTLVFRADLSGDPSFGAFLDRVRDVCVEVYAHQETPFEKLVEDLHPHRDPSRNPLFQVMFAMQAPPNTDIPLPGLRVAPIRVDRWWTRFDLELHFWEHPDHFRGLFVFAADLFDTTTVERMSAHLRQVLEVATRDADLPLGELLPEADLPAPAEPAAPEPPRAVAADLPGGEPRTELEELVAARWREALDVGLVDVHTNFFDVGGTSLLLARVHEGLQRDLARELRMVDLLRFPTVRSFAAFLSGEQESRTAGQDRARARTQAMKQRRRRR
ncbi:hypothetical protein GCM10009634_57630 [Saccharothrix xinjiangensis]